MGDATAWSRRMAGRLLGALGLCLLVLPSVQLADPFPNNPGDKLGSLVATDYGKGTWVYIGLNLWRQLPAGTEGAYQLLANLISLSKAPRPGSAR